MFDLIPSKRNRGLARQDDLVDFYNMVDGFFNDSWPFRSSQNGSFKLDVRDNEHEYLIDAELPGYAKEDIKLDMDDGRLTISVIKQEDVNEEKENYIHRERRLSSMQRTLSLRGATREGISAKFENGILSITVPKSEETRKNTAIEIQ